MNDVPIYDANGNKQAFSTLETAPGKHTQRTIAQTVVDGVPVDASTAAPVPVALQGTTPVSGPLTNTQLRATPIQVAPQGTTPVSGPLTNTELRATPVPIVPQGTTPVSGPLTDTQLRATPIQVAPQGTTPVSGPLTDTQLRTAPVPVAPQGTTPVSGPLTNTELRAAPVPIGVRDGLSSSYTPLGRAADGVSGSDGIPGVAAQLYSGVTGWRLHRTASTATDQDLGLTFAPAGQMLYDQGTSLWARARLPYSEALLARAVRGPSVDPANDALTVNAPWVSNRGFRGVLVAIRVWAAPEAQANVGLSMKVLAMLGGTIAQGTLAPTQTGDANLIKAPGIYWVVVYPGAGIGLAGPGGGAAPNFVTPEWPLAVASLPLPPRWSVSIHHRGGAAATGSWDYEVAASYIP